MLRVQRRGMVLIYTMLATTLFACITILSVDYGRAQIAKTELIRVTDAAARHAVTGIYNFTTLSKANKVGSLNLVDNAPYVFGADQVEAGSWDDDTETFSPGGTPTLAVRVTASRSVPTVFGSYVGVNSATVHAASIAKLNIGKYGLIGLDYINMGGNSLASYFSTTGAQVPGHGNIASNGNILLGGSSHIDGNVYVQVGKSVTGGTINGSIRTLYSPLSYPNGDPAPYGPSNNDNGYLPNWAKSANDFHAGSNKNVTMPAGHYFFKDFTLSAGCDLNVTGPVTIYCYGNVDMSGNAATLSNVPGNLSIVMVPDPSTGQAPGTMHIGSTADLYASVYAPQSPVLLSGNGDLYGAVVGKSVDITGNGNIHYDMSLDANKGAIQLVK